jgi:alpha-beta hydrolase superfamily lysophospholipase
VKIKRKIRVLIIGLSIILISANVIAYFHAYKFTHFDTKINSKTDKPEDLSFGQKIKTLFLGIDLPKPLNKRFPQHDYETIKLYSNSEIECWDIKADSSIGTVILFHGFSGEKSSMLDKADVFLELKYNVMLVDFMGSGGSDGVQTTIGFKEALDVKTSVDYVSKNSNKDIILYGTSMGSVAIMKAINDYNLPIKSIIIECPFGTMLETVKSRFSEMNIPSFPMAHLLMFWGGVQNGFNSYKHNPVDYARHIDCPTLLLYGEEDIKVSRKEIDDIYKNLNGKKQ